MSVLTRSLLLIGAALSLIVACILILSAGLPERAAYTGTANAGEIPVAPEIGALAPPFTLANVEGQTINLADLRGGPVIVNFWATWCIPCAVEMPELEAVYAGYGDQGLRILGINLGETREAVAAWQQAFALSYDLLLDPSQHVAALYRLRGQPTTYIVSPRGTITHIFYGPINAGTLRDSLATILQE